jgi:hypothetical protein
MCRRGDLMTERASGEGVTGMTDVVIRLMASLLGRLVRCPHCRQREAPLAYGRSRGRRVWRCRWCRVRRW